jgi:hypothetical protein
MEITQEWLIRETQVTLGQDLAVEVVQVDDLEDGTEISTQGADLQFQVVPEQADKF